MATATANAGPYVGLYEAARLLSVNPSTVKRLLADGELSGRHIPGTHARILRSSIEALLARCTYGSTPTPAA